MNLKKYKNIFFKYILLICVIFLVILYFLNSSIKQIINIIIVSIITAYALKPLRNFYESKLKINRKIAATLVILTVLGCITGCVIVIVPSLYDEISNIGSIIESISEKVESFVDFLNAKNIPFMSSIYNEVSEKGDYYINKFSRDVLDNIIVISSNLVSFAVVPIIVYYLLCEGDMLYKKTMLVLPTKKRVVIENIISDIDKVLLRYISGQFLLCIIIGILTFLILIILKVKYPLWISILNAVFNIIPYFGPVLGIIPAAVVAFLDSPLKALYAILAMVLLQQIEGNILSPKITGDSTDIHPFVIIILILIGDKLCGMIGMILIIPLAVIVKVIYEDINYYIF